MIKTNAGELSSDGDGRTETRDGGGGKGGLSLGNIKPQGGLSPMAQATIEKHMSGTSKRILLTQAINKKSQSKDAGTITGNYYVTTCTGSTSGRGGECYSMGRSICHVQLLGRGGRSGKEKESIFRSRERMTSRK